MGYEESWMVEQFTLDGLEASLSVDCWLRAVEPKDVGRGEMSEERRHSVEEMQQQAVRYFCEKPGNFPAGRPYNCCESVLLTLAEDLDMDSGLIPSIGTTLGAGVSVSGLLCGSVSSVALTVGIKHGRCSPEESPELAWSLMDGYPAAFRERFRYVNCRQLTGLDMKTPEGLKDYFARVHDQECTQRLSFAVETAVEILGGPEPVAGNQPGMLGGTPGRPAPERGSTLCSPPTVVLQSSAD